MRVIRGISGIRIKVQASLLFVFKRDVRPSVRTLVVVAEPELNERDLQSETRLKVTPY